MTHAPLTTIDEAVRDLVIRTLDAFGGNKVKAAESLGCSLKTIYNHVHRYETEGVTIQTARLTPEGGATNG